MKYYTHPVIRLAALSVITTAASHAADILVTADIAANTRWTANNQYILTKTIVVKPGFTLTIEPGTKVLGLGDNKGTVSKTDDEYGSLVIARDADLIADGTAEKPIVFDAYASVYGFDDNGRNTGPSGPRTLPIGTRGFPQVQTQAGSNGTGTFENPNLAPTPATNDSPLKSGGQWGGLIVLGKAPINLYTGSTQSFEKTIEGFPVSAIEDLKYGADSEALWDANDCSGVIRFVSLRFGGYEFAPNSEINGLTLGGVGRGTVVEYVEVVSNNDDGFEFFGGTVNTKYLASIFNKDDSFDIDEGHQGKHQFWFALQNNTTTATFGDNGMELDGGNTLTDLTNNLAPFTTPDIYNITLIGKGASAPASDNHAMRLRDSFKGKIHNSLITDFGVSLRADTTLVTGDLPVVNNTVFGDFTTAGNGTYKVTTNAGALPNSTAVANTPAGTNSVPAPAGLTSISRTANGLLDPRPTVGSIAFTHTRTTVPTTLVEEIATVNYDGAFGESLWIRDWTFLDEKGYLPTETLLPVASRPTVTVSADISANTIWTANNVYILTKAIVVKSGFTLTIEPGTTILGVGDNKGTAPKTDDDYGSLVIARDANLIADGTASMPIIFDAYASVYGFDDNGRNTGPSGPRTQPLATRGFPQIQTTNSNGTGTFENPNLAPSPAGPGSPLKSGGLWGGLIVLGKAPINLYTGSTQSFEKTIEGFPVSAIEDLKYGADSEALWDANDSSGMIRHVSLRFGGYEFAPNSEINGLTLGGVGRGTVVEYVEVVSNNDDGFEFFGGTVNTKYLASIFNKDDSFDIDEGHQGKHQFWFALQNNTTTATFGDNGMELDGGNTLTDLTNNLAPFTTPDIYNITLIGKGSTAPATDNHSMRLRDSFKGKIHNSLITDFGVSLRADTTLVTGDLPVVNNTVFGDFTTAGSGTYKVTTNAGALPNSTTVANTPAGTNSVPAAPGLTSISRTANGLLDPRPTVGSIAFTHTQTSISSTLAEDIACVDYDGAFGAARWVEGWTYLDEKNYLDLDTDGDGLSDAQEAILGTNPTLVDTDGDGANDGFEVLTYGTNPLDTDTDNDGVSDGIEITNIDLGFNPLVADGGTVIGGLYTSSSILDLVTGSQVMIQGGGNGGNTTLSVPLYRSSNLTLFTPAPALDATFPGIGEKEFYRIEVGGAE